jgi:toxin ParE1/3/4
VSVNQYRLSKLAIADLESIWSYTNENWSKEQADDYIKFIYSKINLLSVNPEIG